MAKSPRCPICKRKYVSIEGLGEHMESKHSESIPEGMNGAQYLYFLRTGKMHGTCVICKKETKWNPHTHKYSRLCGNPKCKQAIRDQYKKNMLGTHGKITLLNDPEHQRKMLSHRKISGRYTFQDGTMISYVGSYEKRFLEFLDQFFSWDPADILSPSPFTYQYEYEGAMHFYIPDLYIPSLDLNIEIKDGGKNPNNHPKIQGVDKIKEASKDKVMLTQATSYIKIYDNDFGNFVRFLLERKKEYIKGLNVHHPLYFIEDQSSRALTEAWAGSPHVKDPKILMNYYRYLGEGRRISYSKTRAYLEKELERCVTLQDVLFIGELADKIAGDCSRELEDEEGYQKYDAQKILEYLNGPFKGQYQKKEAYERHKISILRTVSEASAPTESDIVYSKKKPVDFQGKKPDGFFYENDRGVRWNSIKWVGERAYRETVETLIFKGDKVFLHNKEGYVRVPGGSIEKNTSFKEQAIAEIQEEARLRVKDIRPQFDYFFHPSEIEAKQWKAAKKYHPFVYTGKYVHLFSAIYEGPYDGYVDPADEDRRMINEGRFYPLKEAYKIASEEHKKVIEWYANTHLRNYTLTESSELEESIDQLELLLEASSKEKKKLLFIPLFSNDTPFARIIKKVTGQPYSHAGISLDTSMNNIWSFSNIPYVKNTIFNGFVRESIYAPQYVCNIFFDVFALEVTEEKFNKVKERIESLKKKGIHNFRYNTIGLIEYYFHKSRAGLIPLEKRAKYFCSEFTAYMINEAKELPSMNTLISPGDMASIEGVFLIGRYNIKTFKEEKLKQDIEKRLRDRNSEAVYEAIGFGNVFQHLIDHIESIWQEPLMVRYVGLLDWKALRDHYKKRFGKKGLELYDHFYMIEAIVRAFVYRFGSKSESLDYTEKFKKAMDDIQGILRDRQMIYQGMKDKQVGASLIHGPIQKFRIGVDMNGKVSFL